MKNIVCGSLLAAILLSTVVTAQAQVTFGPKVGLNLSSAKYELSDSAKADGLKNEDVKRLVGASFGLMLNARFGKIAIQPALTYSMKGFKYDRSETITKTDGSLTETSVWKTRATMKLNYIDLPVNFVYTTGGDHGFQVFAGPYLGFAIGSTYDYAHSLNYTETGGKGSVEFLLETSGKGDIKSGSEVSKAKSDADFGDGSTTPKADYLFSTRKGLDVGFNLGLGYLVKNFQIQASYGMGFSNLAPTYADKDAEWGSKTEKNRVIQFTAGYLFGGRAE